MRESELSALSLSMQSGVPYMGLRDLDPDPRLLLYVPAPIARAASVVPVSLRDNRLQLACAAPDPDLSAIGTRFPRLDLELCVVPADEIRELLGRMNGEHI